MVDLERAPGVNNDILDMAELIEDQCTTFSALSDIAYMSDRVQCNLLPLMCLSGAIIGRMLHDVQRLHQIDEGGLEIERAPFSFERGILKTAQLFRKPIEDRNLTLRIEIQLLDSWLRGQTKMFNITLSRATTTVKRAPSIGTILRSGSISSSQQYGPQRTSSELLADSPRLAAQLVVSPSFGPMRHTRVGPFQRANSMVLSLAQPADSRRVAAGASPDRRYHSDGSPTPSSSSLSGTDHGIAVGVV